MWSFCRKICIYYIVLVDEVTMTVIFCEQDVFCRLNSWNISCMPKIISYIGIPKIIFSAVDFDLMG